MPNNRRSKGEQWKMIQGKLRDRFDNLFSGTEEPPTDMGLRQVEALKARVAELETKLGLYGPAVDRLPVTTARDEAGASLPAGPEVEARKLSTNPQAEETRKKRIGQWTAGILAALGLILLIFSFYMVYIAGPGKPDLSDKTLQPVAFLMFAAGLAGWTLIRRGRFVPGTWLLLAIVLVPPVAAVLVLKDIFVVMVLYEAVLAPILIAWVLPRESRQRAILATAISLLVIISIQAWNPAFRLGSSNLPDVTTYLIILAALALTGFFIRQAMVGNIRMKMIAVFVGLALVSVTVIGLISNQVTRAETARQAGENIHALAQSQAQTVGSEIVKQIELISTLRDNTALEKAVVDANAGYFGDGAYIQSLIGQLDKIWIAADAANDNASPLVQSVLHNTVATDLLAFQKAFPDHVEIFVTDRYGASIASTDRTSDYNQGDETWWQDAYNGGKGAVYVGQPEFDESTKTYAINMAVPVQDEASGEVIGVIRSTYRLAAFSQILAGVHFGRTGVTDLIFANNELVGSDTPREVVDAATQAALKSISGDFGQIVFDGVLQVVSKAPVVSSSPETAYLDNLGWTLVTSQTAAEAMQPVAAQTQTILFVSLGVLLAAVALGVFAAQILSTPITRLTAVAGQVAGGDLNIQASVTTRDEIGVLAGTFNKMTAQLRGMIGSLERRVAERTHDLELAAEVGQAVSEKTADLYGLLSAAVELIRERFNLYYTQIYLLDPTGRMLLLRAGTGEVGKQLIDRGHQLAVGLGSLNGRAAFEKAAVIVSDTAQSAAFLPNPLLPNTRSEMAVPLVVGEQVVGVLDMQSEQPGALNESNLPAFQTLAGELAIAIQNAALFAETRQARTEVEDQVRRLTEHGWQDFMDAIDRGEKVGYASNQTGVFPLTSDAFARTAAGAYQAPIVVTGAEIGAIQVSDDPDRKWTPGEAELVQAAAAQLGQHIENLRLLAQTERYRDQAEQVARRLTHEGWKAMQSAGNIAQGYAYDLNQVRKLAAKSHGDSGTALRQPLVVRDETIGELTVALGTNQDGAGEIIAAVAEQLSGHIENLRLSEQNEKRAHELETVAEVSSTTSTVLDPDRLLQAVVDLTQERFGIYHDHIYLMNNAERNLRLAVGAGEIGRRMVAAEHNIPLDTEKSLVAMAARDRQAVIVNDVRKDPDFMANPLLPETRSEMAIPMIVGETLLGVFDVQSDKVNHFSDEDAHIYSTLASQVGIALQNARLYAEQAATVTQLRELDRLKSSFLANMSHELRTPLNSILGFTDVMLEQLDGPLTENMDNDLHLIQKNGQHLLNLINDVLDMAKIEAGRMNLSPERFRINEIMEEVVSITSPLASEKSLSLYIEDDSDKDVMIFADRTRIRQVMINLVNNAMKFTEKGKIRLRAVRQDEKVLVSVHDSGVGIPPDKLEVIFQEFVQVDTSATRKVGGTGLGLPISRKLIEMHGGRLWAESTGIPGEGSVFYVELMLEAKITEPIEKREK